MEPQPKLKVSFRLFLLNVAGVLAFEAGIYCWFDQGQAPSAFSRLAGSALMVMGAALVAVFMNDLFKRVRAQHAALRQHTQHDGNQG